MDIEKMTQAHVAAFAISVFAIWALSLGAIYRRTLSRRTRLRWYVFNDLDNAYSNGYFEPEEHCHGMTADDLAQDLLLYSEGGSAYYADDVTPYVREWLTKKGLPA